MTRRLGLLVPSADVVVESDFHRFLPPGLGFHTSRMFQGTGSRVGEDTLHRILDSALVAAESLAHAAPELILFCCTAASFLKGYGADRELAGRITAATGIPATTTSTAVVEALAALGARRVLMLTPYPDELNLREVGFLGDHGIRVVDYRTFDCRLSTDIPAVQLDEIRGRVLDSRPAISGCDAVFVSCTNLRAMELVETLEAELDRPVVTSNAATMWAGLRHLAVSGTAVPGGRLFRLDREKGVER